MFTPEDDIAATDKNLSEMVLQLYAAQWRETAAESAEME